jgi:hypothetical protein
MTRSTRATIFAALMLAAAACGGSAAPGAPSVTASPAVTSPPASPSADPGGDASTLALEPAPADLGCDAMGVAYRSVRFKIDAAAADQVTAIADTGAALRTYWSAGFRGGPVADGTVLGPQGEVVASDGEELPIPTGAWPRLGGYFVCPAPTAIYVLATDPE